MVLRVALTDSSTDSLTAGPSIMKGALATLVVAAMVYAGDAVASSTMDIGMDHPIAPEMVGGYFMKCGKGVAVCGVLTLESGLAKGNYHHEQAYVHGLWPQVGSYGTSQCLAPKNHTGPNHVYSCYAQEGTSTKDLLGFEKHEWSKHGMCSGTKGVDDYFNQICAMAVAPLKAMNKAKPRTLDAMASAVNKTKEYSIVSMDTRNSQISLSACLTKSGQWVLAAVEDFHQACA